MATTSTVESPTALQRYLLSALVEEEAVLEELNELVKKTGATIVKSESLGMRRLAFAIQKKTELVLTSVFFTAEPSTIAEINKQLKVTPSVKRYLLSTWSADPTELPRRSRPKPDFKEEGTER